ncbi:hypothetical protein NX059_001192 [Plenodomus lindquistii]|nr:hypothetical protein NX059_001192 [Plenodomus lindquistii]
MYLNYLTFANFPVLCLTASKGDLSEAPHIRVSEFRHLTYEHKDLGPQLFYLDQTLSRMPDPASLTRPSGKREIGTLSRLPTELLLNVIQNVPVSNLMQFRRCNRFAASLVDSELGSIIYSAPNVLKGIVALELSAEITSPQLRRLCAQKTCFGCRYRRAMYIYPPPTYRRICFHCITLGGFGGSSFSTPTFEWDVLHRWGVPRDQLDQIPSFQCPQYTFTNGVNVSRITARHKLYDADAAERKMYEREPYARYYVGVSEEDSDRYMALSLGDNAVFDKNSSCTDIIPINEPAPVSIRMPMCVVYAPWIEELGKIEHGFFCSTCLYSYGQDEAYTDETFLAHLEDCRVRPYYSPAITWRHEYLTLVHGDK